VWHELKILAAVVAAVVIFMGGFLYIKMVFQLPPENVDVELLVEYEDDPNWDCHTMGNKVCGL
jgi:hypothetical protein